MKPYRLLLRPKWATNLNVLQRRYLSLHEYQAQDLLKLSGVTVPRGRLATSPAEVARELENYGGRGVIKSQVLAGGRGKGTFKNGFQGGVHVVSS